MSDATEFLKDLQPEERANVERLVGALHELVEVSDGLSVLARVTALALVVEDLTAAEGKRLAVESAKHVH